MTGNPADHISLTPSKLYQITTFLDTIARVTNRVDPTVILQTFHNLRVMYATRTNIKGVRADYVSVTPRKCPK